MHIQLAEITFFVLGIKLNVVLTFDPHPGRLFGTHVDVCLPMDGDGKATSLWSPKRFYLYRRRSSEWNALGFVSSDVYCMMTHKCIVSSCNFVGKHY